MADSSRNLNHRNRRLNDLSRRNRLLFKSRPTRRSKEALYQEKECPYSEARRRDAHRDRRQPSGSS